MFEWHTKLFTFTLGEHGQPLLKYKNKINEWSVFRYNCSKCHTGIKLPQLHHFCVKNCYCKCCHVKLSSTFALVAPEGMVFRFDTHVWSKERRIVMATEGIGCFEALPKDVHAACVQVMIDAATYSAWSVFCLPPEHSRRRQRWPFRRAGRLRSYRSWHRAGRGQTQSHCWLAARRCPSADAPGLLSSPRVRCRSSTALLQRSWRLPRAHMLPGIWQTAILRLTESSR